MNQTRWIFLGVTILVTALGAIAGCNSSTGESDSAKAAEAPSIATTSVVADDQFTVPNGSANELLDFIQKLASPDQFKNEAEMKAYLQKASRAIGAAADRVLTKATTDQQLADAVDWKLESFRIMRDMGDAGADAGAEQFLVRMKDDKRPAVRAVAARQQFTRGIQNWQSQDAAQRLALLNEYIAAVKANGLKPADLDMLHDYSIRCSQGLFATSDAAGRPFRELLPLVRSNADPQIAGKAEKFEAVIRRLELPGKKLELEGKLFDGQQLDWKSYRGKVVLIDFWASDCSECILEIPNLVKLYRMYHDKGFEILGVNLDHERPLVADLLEKANITWPQVFDDNPEAGHWEHPLSTKFAIDALPRMILVDKDGTVVHTNARGSVLADQLKKLLGEPAVAAEDAIPKIVPDGSAAEIMAYVEGVLQKLAPPRSREEQQQNLEQVRGLLGAAADKILAGEPNAEEASQAIQMKLASLQQTNAAGPGDNQEQAEFLKRLEADPKPAIAGALAEFRLMQALSRWDDLPAADRAAAVDKYVPFAKNSKPGIDHIRLVSNLADMSAESGDMLPAKRLIDALLPLYADRSDPQIAKLASMLEGIGRRAVLPGNQIELEGTLLDGKKLDWAAYRGKVVLVDFWASWCGPCREEVPNILRNYKTYHDQGFEVLGVCLDDELPPAKAYINEAGIPWPSLFSADPAAIGFDSPIAVKYGITGIPVAILVDREGKVVTMLARGPYLDQHLKRLMDEPGQAKSADR
jgi:thiol-disulfide isomerase/thioredoxin